MTKRFTLLLLTVLICFNALPASASVNNVVRICGDRDPLSMAADHNKTTQLIGFSVDMMRAVFGSLGKQVEFISDLPFRRCLSEVENGSIDFAMDAYFDLDRDKIFTYSTHYTTLTPQIFFLKSKPVPYQKIGDLKHFRGCGVLGTSYTHYGMKPDNFDLGTDRESLFKKIYAGRCDYFLEELEDIASFKLSGTDYLANPLLQHETVSWAVPPSKFLITAKNGKYAIQMDQINNAIFSVIKSGQAQKYWEKTSIGLPYKP